VAQGRLPASVAARQLLAIMLEQGR
jgi:hypothetical protein